MAAVAKGVRARRKPPIALITLDSLGRGGRDHAPRPSRHGSRRPTAMRSPLLIAAITRNTSSLGYRERSRRRPRRGHALGEIVGTDRFDDMVVQHEGSAQIAAHVLADLGVVDVVWVDGVQPAAGLLGALGRVLRQIARPAAPLLLVVGGELLDIQLLAPADRRGVSAAAQVARRGRGHHRAAPRRPPPMRGSKAYPPLRHGCGRLWFAQENSENPCRRAIAVSPGCAPVRPVPTGVSDPALSTESRGDRI